MHVLLYLKKKKQQKKLKPYIYKTENKVNKKMFPSNIVIQSTEIVLFIAL